MQYQTVFIYLALYGIGIIAAGAMFYYYKKTGLVFLKYLGIYQSISIVNFVTRLIINYLYLDSDFADYINSLHIDKSRIVVLYAVSCVILYFFLKSALSLIEIKGKLFVALNFICAVLLMVLVLHAQFEFAETRSASGMQLVYSLFSWLSYSIYLLSPALVLWGKKNISDPETNLLASRFGYFFLALGLASLATGIAGHFGILDSALSYWLGYLFILLIFVTPTLLAWLYYKALTENVETGNNNHHPEEDYFEKFSISKREREIISLICQGKSNQEIGDELFISIQTVKSHIHNILQKTALSSRMQIMKMFFQSETAEIQAI